MQNNLPSQTANTSEGECPFRTDAARLRYFRTTGMLL